MDLPSKIALQQLNSLFALNYEIIVIIDKQLFRLIWWYDWGTCNSRISRDITFEKQKKI